LKGGASLKDHLRDYCTEAFRFYARIGKPTYQQLRDRLYAEALASENVVHVKGSGPSKPTENAVINAENKVEERIGELLDILAVEKTMRILDCYTRQAIEIVYFTDADKPLQKGDISSRVHQAEIGVPASEKTIYRWLSKARRMFAEERGLRVYNKFS